MQRVLERLLNLRRGDVVRGAMLFGCLFLTISSYVVGQVCRDALFLGRFQAEQLPYADISIFVLVCLVVAAYIRIGSRVGLRNLLVGSLLFLASNGIFFWWLTRAHQWVWVYPLIYVWVGVFGVLAPAQVWTLANYVLTPREAKRVFGLVGSGATLGATFGGFYSKAAATRYGAESLLLAMAAFLVASAILAAALWRRRLQAAASNGTAPTQTAGGEGPRTLQESLRHVSASPYLRTIAGVICISSFVTAVAGWQFKAIAQEALLSKNALAAFFGAFNAYVGVLSLLTQVFLTPRVLRRFDIGTVLFILPVVLLGGSATVLAWGSLWAAVALKGSDKVFRYSIDRPAVELLYLPLPAGMKVQVKSFIDTVIWRLGDGLAGVAVLICVTFAGLSAGQLAWINFVVLVGWLVLAVQTRQRYVSTLRESIQQHRLDAERSSAPVLDRSTTDLLVSRLDAVDPKEILYALSLFGVERRQAAHPAVRGLLRHPAAEVRQRAVAILSAAGDRSVQSEVERLLNDPHLEVRTEALLYLTHHSKIDPLARIRELGDFPDFSIRSAVVAYLARSGDVDNPEAVRLMFEGMVKEHGPAGPRTRLEAVRLAAAMPGRFDEQLETLIQDPDQEVAREAIRTAGGLAKTRFAAALLGRLTDPALGSDAADALGGLGDSVVALLGERLASPATPVELRRDIPGVLLRIGSQAAATALSENLFEADTALRFRVISSLNKLRRLHPEVQVDPPLIETALATEIMGHYRSYQILGTLRRGAGADDTAARGLEEAMNQEVERIFRLLGLLFPRYDLHSAYFGLQSRNPVIHDQALDFLDHVLKPEMRNLLVPLLDGDVSVADRVRRADRILGVPVETPEQAVSAMMASQDPWLKSCAAYAIGALGLRSLEPKLDAWLVDPDPLLREMVRQAKEKLAVGSRAETGPQLSGTSPR